MTPDHFRHIRKNSLDLTQAALGREIGYSRYHISGFECGRAPIPRSVSFTMHWVNLFGVGLPEEKSVTRHL